MILFLISLCCLGAASSQILGLQEGDECTPLGGGHGVCKTLTQCRDPGDFRKEQPPICTFKQKEPVICCPDSLSTKIAGSRVEQYCQNTATPKRSCFVIRYLLGGRQLNIFEDTEFSENDKNIIDVKTNNRTGKHFVHGGRQARIYSHKYMTLIGYGEQNEKKWGCGGSLITSRYILSAAHCVNPFSLGPARWARLGDLDISSNSEDAKPIDMRIVERSAHPEYVETQVYHDIALFKLDSDVAFNAWVMPICLHTQRAIEEDTATVTGWGRKDFAAGTSDQLLEADLTVYNDTECERLMFSTTTTKTTKGFQSETMFCAGVPDGSKDACLGDSGGPLVIVKGGKCVKFQIGVTSYGNQCGLPNSPGVYTRVSNYIPWIENIVFKDNPSLL